MAKGKRIRWECPTGSHRGALGPRRPRKDDIVRYCLRCSEETGRLVERRSPVLERERAQARDRRQRKATRRKPKDPPKRSPFGHVERLIGGVDMDMEMRRLSRLRVFRDGDLPGRLPELRIVSRSWQPQQVGCADYRKWRIIMSEWGQPWWEAVETLLHEMVHLHVGPDPDPETGRSRHHGRRFQVTMREAFRQGYGLDVIQLDRHGCGGKYAAALREREQQERRRSG